ncbi:ribosome assembly factor SBDS [Candidatus Woesearchaeota archaeon]|nr:ribosome assembly factor SBDS [Candidatus Woesearchaeota archaeon]
MKGDQRYKGERPSFNVARLKSGGEKFEVVIDPDAAMKFREGAIHDVRQVVLYDKVFSDAHKGMLASEHLMRSVFNTDDRAEVLNAILKRGEIQLTSEYRDRLTEQKRKWVVNVIHRNAVDPRTGLPHPPQRIENAMAEASVHIDEHKRAEDQVQDIIKKLRSVLPLKFEVREISVRIPAQYAVKSFPVLKKHCTVLKEEWLGDGSLSSTVELPAGMQQGFFDELNHLTHGNCETKIVRTK